MIAKKSHLSTKWYVYISLCSFVMILAAIGFYYIKTRISELNNRIFPNVYIDNQLMSYKTKRDTENVFLHKTKKISDTQFNVYYHDTPIATFSASQINLHYDGKTVADKAYMIGRSQNPYTRYYQSILTILGLKKFNFDSEVVFDRTLILEMISYNEDRYNKPAKNALFKFEQGKVINFRPDEKGLELDSKTFMKHFNDAVKEQKKKIKDTDIVLTSHSIDPEITLANSNTYGIEEFIAEGKSDYTHSIPERIHNLLLATSKFNGVLIPKNKIFSFNEIVGDISSLTGYKPAYIIKDGKTVLGDGGGVCQVSTTLFRAALNSGLPIIERHAHAYRVGYYENDSKPGLDATVFAPYADLKFKNDTSANILVETEADTDNNLLYFRFYGKRDGRKITLSPVTVYDIQPPPPAMYQDDPTLKKGVIKQIDFAAWGSKAYFTYSVTYENKTPKTVTFFSSYQPWKAIFLQGTAD